MARIMVDLDRAEFQALIRLAEQEKRGTSNQAAFLIHEGLQQRHVLPERQALAEEGSTTERKGQGTARKGRARTPK